MENSIPYGPPRPPHLEPRPRWQHDQDLRREQTQAAHDRGLATDVVMRDAPPSPPPTPLPPPPPIQQAPVVPGTSTASPTIPPTGRRIAPPPRPASASGLPATAIPGPVPLFATIDPAARSRIIIPIGRASTSSGGSGSGSPAGNGGSMAIRGVAGVSTPTPTTSTPSEGLLRAREASGMNGTVGGQNVATPNAGLGTATANTSAPSATSAKPANQRPATSEPAVGAGDKPKDTSIRIGDRPPQNLPAIAPKPAPAAKTASTTIPAPVSTTVPGQTPSSASSASLGLTPFLKQVRADLEQQWLRIRDHTHLATTATQLATKERDDALATVKRLEKESGALKKQLVGAKARITSLEKSIKTERENAAESNTAMQAAMTRLGAIEAQLVALKTQLQHRQTELDAALAKHKLVLDTSQKLRLDHEDVKRTNITLEQGNKVLVQEILTLKREAQDRAAEHARCVAAVKRDREDDVNALRALADAARAEVMAVREQTGADERTMAGLRAENTTLAGRLALEEGNAARLRTEMDELGASLRGEKSSFADAINAKNKEMADLSKTLQAATTRSSAASEQVKRYKEEVARLTRRNEEFAVAVEEKEAELIKLTTEHERLRELSQGRVQDNVQLREELRVSRGKLAEKERLHKGLVQEVGALNVELGAQKAACNKLELQVAAQMAENRELEQQKERLEVDLALKSKPVTRPASPRPDPAAIERDMKALEERVRAEEAQKYAEELAKLRAENTSLSSKITRTSHGTVDTPSPTSARTSKRARDEKMTESEKKQYAQQIGSTFFDADGICIACRRTRTDDKPPLTPTAKETRVEHVWRVHGDILDQFRAETRKVSKRRKRESVAKSDAGTPSRGNGS